MEKHLERFVMFAISHVIREKSLQEVLNEVTVGTINPDPIGQRPPVQSGWNKSQGIIDSILRGFSVGTITVRDIENDSKNQEIYQGVNWLVLDGGNRIRAIRDFTRGRFATLKCEDMPEISEKTFLQLSEEYRLKLEETVLQFTVYTCSDSEGTQIFRRLNTVTPVNQIEMIMANDISSPAKIMRSQVKSYKEYGYNKINPLFELTTKADGSMKPVHWATDPNPRRKWDEYVGIALLKSIAGGNFDAGLQRIEKMVDEDLEISKSVLKTVDKFFDDVRLIMNEMGSKKKLNTDIFAALQLVWFGLLEKNKVFKIEDHNTFAKEFFKAHRELTGTNPSELDERTFKFNSGSRENPRTKTEIVRKFVRRAIKNFANPAEQHEASRLYLSLMNIDDAILNPQETRSADAKTRFDKLVEQNYLCAIDGEPLNFDDAVWGHDTAWRKGGQLEDGAVIRNTHNRDMGTTTLDEYRIILNLRKGA